MYPYRLSAILIALPWLPLVAHAGHVPVPSTPLETGTADALTFKQTKTLDPLRIVIEMRLEALHLSLCEKDPTKAQEILERIQKKHKLTDWRVERVGHDNTDYVLYAPPGNPMGKVRGKIFKMVLGHESCVLGVGTSYVSKLTSDCEKRECESPSTDQRLFGVHPDGVKNSHPADWPLQTMKVPAAWELLRQTHHDPNHAPGASVKGAIVDTGFVNHPEIQPRPPAKIILGPNFYEEGVKESAVDRFAYQSLSPNSHASGVLSVIVSPPDKAPTSPEGPNLTGIAWGGDTLVYRASPTFVAVNNTAIAKAIYRAVDDGAKVINLSLGAVESPLVEDALKYAYEHGVIVSAAAGNFVRNSTYPGSSKYTVAAAASTFQNQPWNHSAGGPKVAITTPGSEIWHAQTEMSARGPSQYFISSASGTTFSSAFTYGLAKLWLDQQGWDKLKAKYDPLTGGHGERVIVPLFKRQLSESAWKPDGQWNTKRFGPGIADAEKLLKLPLPDDLSWLPKDN